MKDYQTYIQVLNFKYTKRHNTSDTIHQHHQVSNGNFKCYICSVTYQMFIVMQNVMQLFIEYLAIKTYLLRRIISGYRHAISYTAHQHYQISNDNFKSCICGVNDQMCIVMQHVMQLFIEYLSIRAHLFRRSISERCLINCICHDNS